jgi:hypothetical protein
MANEIYDRVNDFAIEAQNVLRQKLEDDNKVATGQLINSLNYTIYSADNDIGYEVDISGDHLIFADQGRSPGRPPYSLDLVPWVEAKGISEPGYTDEQMAFVIARSIGENGVKASNVIEATKDEMKNSASIDAITESIQNKYTQDIINILEFNQ